MKSFYIKANKVIDEKMYKYIPEVYKELTKKDIKINIIRIDGDIATIDHDYGISKVNKNDIYEQKS